MALTPTPAGVTVTDKNRAQKKISAVNAMENRHTQWMIGKSHIQGMM